MYIYKEKRKTSEKKLFFISFHRHVSPNYNKALNTVHFN